MGVLTSKVALVTDASRSVGAAIAKSLAAEGAAVIVNYLKSEGCAVEVVHAIQDNGAVGHGFRADITDEEAIQTPGSSSSDYA
jgi:NAD(P)-dependent dehydrogenase (short-subunit alcohol dehydrogenase family)